MITRLVAVVSTVVLAGALSACGGGGDGSTSGAPSGANGPKSLSCDLAPASLVNSALGTAVGNPQVQDNGNTIIVCTYPPATGIGTVLIRIQTDRSDGDFTAARAASDANGIPTKDLPGFEDKAYSSVLSAAGIVTNTVVALKGAVEILVSSPAPFAKEQALEEQIFARLS